MFKQLNKSVLLTYYLVSFIAILFLSTPALAKPVEVGRILMATLGVTAQQPNAKPRTLTRRSTIFLGDTIKTPEGGKAQLRMADGEMLSLAAASELTIEAFEYQPDMTDSKNVSVKNLVTGGLRTITGAVKGNDYKMKSRAGVIGIRGTAFEVYSQQGENLFVNVQRGNIFVKNAQGSVDVGVSQRLMAVRITNINLAPEAIPVSELPKFFQDAFTEDTTLSLADNTEQNQQQEADNSDFKQPVGLAGSLQVAQNITTLDLDDKKQILEDQYNRPAKPDPVEPPLDPQPPVVDPEPPIDSKPPVVEPPPAGELIGLSGFAVGLEGVAAEGEMQLVGGYFEGIKKGDASDYTASNGQQVAGLNRLNSIDFTLKSGEVWEKYSLGYSDIFMGIETCSECFDGNIENLNELWSYWYVFATNTLGLDSLPSTGNFNYHVNPKLPGFGGFGAYESHANLNVDFYNRSMNVNIGDNEFHLYGRGSLEDFYNSSIKLNSNDSSLTGDITGRFIGKNAEGAITTYKLGENSENGFGILVFERN